jgi:dihydroflavonol-4-reductase
MSTNLPAERTPKVLVIGASGYLGQALLTELTKRQIDHIGTSRKPLEGSGLIYCDVLDKESITAAITSTGATHVVHTAGMVSHRPEDAERVWKIHVTGTENVCQACADSNVERVIYLSTSGTIAVSDDPEFIPDETAESPFATITQWGYYRSKYFAEQIALEYSKKGLPLICLNPSLLLGAGNGGESMKSVELFLDDKIPLAPCGGIAFVDVEDVAVATANALSMGKNGERYLLNGANLTFADYYARIARLADKPAPMMSMPALTRKALSWFPKLKKVGLHLEKSDVEIASYFWYADSSKAEKELAFNPKDPMDTLLDTVHAVQAKQEDFSWFSET